MLLPDFPPWLVTTLAATLALVVLLLILRFVSVLREGRTESEANGVWSSEGGEGASSELSPGMSPARPEVAEARPTERPGYPESQGNTAQVRTPGLLVQPTAPLVTKEVVPELPEVHLRGLSAAVGEKRLRLFKSRIQIGGDRRNQKNDHVLDVPTLSGEHAELQIFPSGDLWIRDLQSSNGTRVNGVRVPGGKKARLQHGDKVALGPDVIFVVERPSKARDAAVRGGRSHPLVGAAGEARRPASKTRREPESHSAGSTSKRSETIIEKPT